MPSYLVSPRAIMVSGTAIGIEYCYCPLPIAIAEGYCYCLLLLPIAIAYGYCLLLLLLFRALLLPIAVRQGNRGQEKT